MCVHSNGVLPRLHLARARLVAPLGQPVGEVPRCEAEVRRDHGAAPRRALREEREEQLEKGAIEIEHLVCK